VSIDVVIAAAQKMPAVKGEFETAEGFEARKGAVIRSLRPIYLVAKEPHREYFEYDADTKRSQCAFLLDAKRQMIRPTQHRS
jgi:hypothetical protein